MLALDLFCAVTKRKWEGRGEGWKKGENPPKKLFEASYILYIIQGIMENIALN